MPSVAAAVRRAVANRGLWAWVAAGAAGVAGGVLADRVTHDRACRELARRRAFRLDPDEPMAEEMRRIARGRLDDAVDRLRAAAAARGGRSGDPGEAVHEARKDLKRLRALVRLLRDQLGPDVWRRENAALRDAGRRLSDVRDAKVLVETLDDLASRHAGEVPAGAFAGLRAALAAEEEAAHERLRSDPAVIAAATAELEAARGRVAAWPLAEDAAPAALEPGFERIYRRARKAFRAARKDTTTETMHELRKRTKDLWHAAQVVRPLAPEAMGRIARRAHRLADVVGADHDLAVLAEAAAARSDTLGPEALSLLRALVDRRQRRLRREAMRRGRRLYAARPRKLLRPLRAARG